MKSASNPKSNKRCADDCCMIPPAAATSLAGLVFVNACLKLSATLKEQVLSIALSARRYKDNHLDLPRPR